MADADASNATPPEPRNSPQEATAGAGSSKAEPAAGAPPEEAIAQAALKAAHEAISDLGDMAAKATQPGAGAEGAPAPFELPPLSGPAGATPQRGMDLLADVNLNVKIELGRTRMLVEDVLRLGEGAVVELDKLAGDPVDVYVNERHVARGEVLVLNDNFCVRINEILSPAGEREEKE